MAANPKLTERNDLSQGVVAAVGIWEWSKTSTWAVRWSSLRMIVHLIFPIYIFPYQTLTTPVIHCLTFQGCWGAAADADRSSICSLPFKSNCPSVRKWSFCCWLLSCFISSLWTNFMILPAHKNALLNGEEGESGCWQWKCPLPSFYLFNSFFFLAHGGKVIW